MRSKPLVILVADENMAAMFHSEGGWHNAISIKNCTAPAFLDLHAALQAWFPANA